MTIYRSRDVTLYFAGDRQPVSVHSDMLAGGWSGGQGVQWVDNGVDERMVTYSKGLYGGVLYYGSDEVADKFTSMTGQQFKYNYAVLLSGGCLLSTTTYERYTYASRLAYAAGTGPLVPIVYRANDILYFSLRGLFTSESELDLTSDPLAPNFFVGFVAQTPKEANGFSLGVQTSL